MAADDPEKAMDVTDESEEEIDEEGEGKAAKSLTSELLKNPAVMNALQGRLDAMAGSASGYIKVNSEVSLFLVFGYKWF
jgi:hypothetical protein